MNTISSAPRKWFLLFGISAFFIVSSRALNLFDTKIVWDVFSFATLFLTTSILLRRFSFSTTIAVPIIIIIFSIIYLAAPFKSDGALYVIITFASFVFTLLTISKENDEKFLTKQIEIAAISAAIFFFSVYFWHPFYDCFDCINYSIDPSVYLNEEIVPSRMNSAFFYPKLLDRFFAIYDSPGIHRYRLDVFKLAVFALTLAVIVREMFRARGRLANALLLIAVLTTNVVVFSISVSKNDEFTFLAVLAISLAVGSVFDQRRFTTNSFLIIGAYSVLAILSRPSALLAGPGLAVLLAFALMRSKNNVEVSRRTFVLSMVVLVFPILAEFLHNFDQTGAIWTAPLLQVANVDENWTQFFQEYQRLISNVSHSPSQVLQVLFAVHFDPSIGIHQDRWIGFWILLAPLTILVVRKDLSRSLLGLIILVINLAVISLYLQGANRFGADGNHFIGLTALSVGVLYISLSKEKWFSVLAAAVIVTNVYGFTHFNKQPLVHAQYFHSTASYESVYYNRQNRWFDAGFPANLDTEQVSLVITSNLPQTIGIRRFLFSFVVTEGDWRKTVNKATIVAPFSNILIDTQISDWESVAAEFNCESVEKIANFAVCKRTD